MRKILHLATAGLLATVCVPTPVLAQGEALVSCPIVQQRARDAARAYFSGVGRPQPNALLRDLRRTYAGWDEYLPSCPATAADAAASDRWVIDPNPWLACFHPQAATCFRSTATYRSPGAPYPHCQQCCYRAPDRPGGPPETQRLMRSGFGRGTPDFAAPNAVEGGLDFYHYITADRPVDYARDWDAHTIYDVFTWAALAPHEYASFWRPSNADVVLPSGAIPMTMITMHSSLPNGGMSNYERGIPVRAGDYLEVRVTGQVEYSINRQPVVVGPDGVPNQYGIELHTSECALGMVIAVTFDETTGERLDVQCMRSWQVFPAAKTGRIGFFVNVNKNWQVGHRSGTFRVGYGRTHGPGARRSER